MVLCSSRLSVIVYFTKQLFFRVKSHKVIFSETVKWRVYCDINLLFFSNTALPITTSDNNSASPVSVLLNSCSVNWISNLTHHFQIWTLHTSQRSHFQNCGAVQWKQIRKTKWSSKVKTSRVLVWTGCCCNRRSFYVVESIDCSRGVSECH